MGPGDREWQALCREETDAQGGLSPPTSQNGVEGDKSPHVGDPLAQLCVPGGQRFLLCLGKAGLPRFRKNL